MVARVGRDMGLIESLHRQIVWPLWSRRDHHSLPRYVRELERRRADSMTVIRARQQAMLQRIVRHAIATTSYYRSLRTERFEDFPTLNKQTMRECHAELLSQSFDRRQLTEKKTSGSTGVPLRVFID